MLTDGSIRPRSGTGSWWTNRAFARNLLLSPAEAHSPRRPLPLPPPVRLSKPPMRSRPSLGADAGRSRAVGLPTHHFPRIPCSGPCFPSRLTATASSHPVGWDIDQSEALAEPKPSVTANLPVHEMPQRRALRGAREASDPRNPHPPSEAGGSCWRYLHSASTPSLERTDGDSRIQGGLHQSLPFELGRNKT